MQIASGAATQGLLNKRPGDRLGWPGLLEHPFVRETSQERLKREAALADAAATAQESRAWKGEGGAVAGCQAHTRHYQCVQLLTLCSAIRSMQQYPVKAYLLVVVSEEPGRKQEFASNLC